MNKSRTCANHDTQLARGNPVSFATRYELIDREGHDFGRFNSAAAAAAYAKWLWPDQEQDPERTGAGWDVQVEGAK